MIGNMDYLYDYCNHSSSDNETVTDILYGIPQTSKKKLSPYEIAFKIIDEVCLLNINNTTY